MAEKKVTVVAVLKAKPGREAQVRKELQSLVEPSRKDAGCINYDLHQGCEVPTLFMFHENWVSKEHLDAHLAKAELQSVLARVSVLLAEPPQITLWDRIA